MNLLPACQFCRTPLTAQLCDLGATPLANAFVTAAGIAGELSYPLVVRICPACLLVQASEALPPDAIFSDYPYFSSMSEDWVAHARAFAETAQMRFGLNGGSKVIEIASNDGYLLQHFKALGINVLGVEPAANVAAVARSRGIPTQTMFLGLETGKMLAARRGRADLIVANNVLAHVPDIADFLSGIAALLKTDGIASFEFPHILQMMAKVQFDTIYHEHFSYLSLMAAEPIFAAAGLAVFDAQELTTHGGSLRLTASLARQSRPATTGLLALRSKENTAGLGTLAGYFGFADKICETKASFAAFLTQARAEGKSVAAYGAAAKGNTFLNVCGTKARDIACVFDRSPSKQGKFLPGSHIPVRPVEDLQRIRPDYLLILPWNIASEIMRQTSIIQQWGGRFVTAIPKIQIYP